ncbi:MAG: SDR family oxidoreductase [Planctomycetaceae bacterium]|jgi:NAD(P)-dependent dehydrogenase (short-subunit alcohol dehydrogenase family)|nr:SDR family oxidoreductase [Planctomycetaceae bacterium]
MSTLLNSAEYLKSLFGMEGEVAVVIGGAGELGGALSAGLGQAGAHVVVADMGEEACKSRVEKLKTLHVNTSYAVVNITERNSINNLLKESLKITGKVDMLINCAGINVGTPFLEVDPDQWDKIFAVNLKGMMEACQVFIKSMLNNEEGGAILNIGSVNSDRPLSRVFAYAASKAGVVNLTQNIAQEFATKKIRANSICPGFFPAEQNRKLLDAERVDNIMRGTPMRRYGTPDELVGAALLLLSKKAGSYMTGSTVYVDGGFTCSWF